MYVAVTWYVAYSLGFDYVIYTIYPIVMIIPYSLL